MLSLEKERFISFKSRLENKSVKGYPQQKTASLQDIPSVLCYRIKLFLPFDMK